MVSYTGDLNPIRTAPMLGTHKSVVATAGNVPGSLRSGRLFPAVPHFKRAPCKAWRFLSGESPVVITPNQKSLPSVAV